MENNNKIFLTHIPLNLKRYIASHPRHPVTDYHDKVDATILFVDVSGFTAMSEELAKIGKEGAEELSGILSMYFNRMIKIAAGYGGIIAKIAGDAMSVVFERGAHKHWNTITRKAFSCALSMQEAVKEFTDIKVKGGTFTISMKIGIGSGILYSQVVGTEELGLEYIIAGRAVDNSAEAEHHADKGEIWVDEFTMEKSKADFDKSVDGYWRLRNLENLSKPHKTPYISPDAIAIEKITPFAPGKIGEQLRLGNPAIFNEHRLVSVVFVNFFGLDFENDLKVGDKLQEYYTKMQVIVNKYKGRLNEFEAGDKGCKIILFFGAPTSHENDAERAVLCSLAIREEGKKLPFVTHQNVGITTGYVFTGFVGGEKRQIYTAIGDKVNLSARLMQAAENSEVLCDDESYEICKEFFLFSDPEDIRVKGKSQKVTVYKVQEGKFINTIELQEPEYKLPMVGRKEELNTISEAMNSALKGQGQIVGITAEAGMGKSRLNAEAIKLAMSKGFIGFGGMTQSYGTKIPYLVWHNLLRGFFNVSTELSREEQINKLKKGLADYNPQFVQRLPLLGTALGIDIPDNDLTRSFDAKLRKASLEALITDVIRIRAEREPLFLVFEDCHWIDPSSLDLLNYLARNIVNYPVVMMLVYRPIQIDQIKWPFDKYTHFTEIELKEFTDTESSELIKLKLEGLSLPEFFIKRITEKAQGNPFFIDEMINLLQDKEVDIYNEKALREIEVPDSLYNLIISRIDRLNESEKLTIKVASVIGRLFRAEWLYGIYPINVQEKAIKDNLGRLSRLDLTPLDRPEPELVYLFKHIVTQEVAYNSLSFSARRKLHEKMAEYIEGNYKDSIDEYLDYLTHHYGNTDRQDKIVYYLEKVARKAKEQYANEVAIEAYEHLIDILSEWENAEPPIQEHLVNQMLKLDPNWGEDVEA